MSWFPLAGDNKLVSSQKYNASPSSTKEYKMIKHNIRKQCKRWGRKILTTTVLVYVWRLRKQWSFLIHSSHYSSGGRLRLDKLTLSLLYITIPSGSCPFLPYSTILLKDDLHICKFLKLYIVVLLHYMSVVIAVCIAIICAKCIAPNSADIHGYQHL